MSRSDNLDALLTELVGRGDAEGLTPEDLVEMFGALGVRVDQDEVMGASLLTLNALPGDFMRVGLDAMLEHMNADQLKQVAKRFNTGADASRVAESKKAVLKALGNPLLLDKMIADLSPLERALLSEVKRRGGVADGWALIVYAALHGFEPNERVGSGSVYKHYLDKAPGMGYLGVLLRDGLLIPASNQASWFTTSHYYAHERGSGDDLVFVDHRVLARLPDEERPSPQPLALEPLTTATPTASHPLQKLLELFDVMQLILEEGGLQITQRGTVGKPMLSRLVKRRPWLEARLERLLKLCLSLSLLNAPESNSTKDPWRVNLPLLNKLQGAPLPITYAFMVEAFLHTTEVSADDPWSMRRSSLVSEAAAKRALLDSLEVLPDHPVSMEEALEGLWKRTLRYVVMPHARYRRAEEDTEAERPAWFTETLLGAFHDLGLVAVAELPGTAKPAADEPAVGSVHVMQGGKVTRVMSPSEGDTAHRYAVTPALGLTWLAQGQRLQRAKQPPGVEQLRHLLGLNPDTGKPNEPSLLIQPNFDILVYLGKLSPLALTALNCADCNRIDAQTASYTISRSSFYRALEAGLELHILLELLRDHSMGVPDNVARSLRDWASRRERLRMKEDAKLLEYASRRERDTALKKLEGARALAERFVLLINDAQPPRVNVRHQYSLAPTRTLRFHPEGHFRLEGALDLAGRAVLAHLATQDASGTYHLDVSAIRAGMLTTAARDALITRAQGGIPPQLEALISIWEGKGAAPTLARISVFQHPSAAALAKHPKIGPHLGDPLNETSYLIKEGHEELLEQLLTDLGVRFKEAFKADMKAQAIQGSVMQTGLDTRKMRVMIETAIGQGRSLELRYHQEKANYNRYGYTTKSRGRVVTEKVAPESVEYSGSTPYLSGKALGQDAYRTIRIGYITGIAVL